MPRQKLADLSQFATRLNLYRYIPMRNLYAEFKQYLGNKFSIESNLC